MMTRNEVAENGRIEVLDESGNVQRWLKEGRGVAVWENVDLSSSRCGNLVFTPADKGTDNPPHWSMRLKSVHRLESDFAFYVPGRYVDDWSDTTNGYNAAIERIAKLPTANPKDAPLQLKLAYTVDRIVIIGCSSTDSEHTPIFYGNGIHAFFRYRWAIREWVLRVN